MTCTHAGHTHGGHTHGGHTHAGHTHGGLTPRVRLPAFQALASPDAPPATGPRPKRPRVTWKGSRDAGQGLSGGRQPGREGAGLRGGPSPVSAPPVHRSHDRLRSGGFLAAPLQGMKRRKPSGQPGLADHCPQPSLPSAEARPEDESKCGGFEDFFPLKPYFLNPNSQLGE